MNHPNPPCVNLKLPIPVYVASALYFFFRYHPQDIMTIPNKSIMIPMDFLAITFVLLS